MSAPSTAAGTQASPNDAGRAGTVEPGPGHGSRPSPPLPELPALFKLVLVLGTLVLGLWTAKVRERHSPRPVPAGPAHEHDHPELLVRFPSASSPPPGALAPSVPWYARVGDFRLVESDGSRLDLARLAGRPWVASFLFTRCAGTCPAVADAVAVLQHAIPEGALLVSVSVDPERDTPEALRLWGETKGRVPERWLLATGSRLEVTKLAARGFYLGSGSELMHSTRVFLVDGAAGLRGSYETSDPEAMARLLTDLSLLLAPPG